MDGFEGNTGIIILAATNRADVLDPALLRPGRFDRRVPVDLPDVSGRLSILKVHAKGKPLGPTASLEKTAKRTIGFSGASLANLMNEAAIVAARRSKTEISADEIDYAIDRIQVRHVTPHLSPATPTFSHPISRPHICGGDAEGHGDVVPQPPAAGGVPRGGVRPPRACLSPTTTWSPR